MCHIGTAHTRHQFTTAITPTGSSHLGSEACTGSCQQAVTGEQAPCIGNGVIGEHILAETVPFGFVAQIEAVLTALYGAEEYLKINTSEESHMTVSDRRAGTSHNGLATKFATSILGVVNPHRSRRSAFPQGSVCPTLLQFCYGHIHTIGVHCWCKT